MIWCLKLLKSVKTISDDSTFYERGDNIVLLLDLTLTITEERSTALSKFSPRGEKEEQRARKPA